MISTFKTEEDVVQDSIKNKKPTVERDLVIAKAFLKQQSEGGDNIYDHLSSILLKVIDERPKNVMDYFEEFNRAVRNEKNRNENSLLSGTYVEPDSLKFAKTFLHCFNKFSTIPSVDEQKSIEIDDFMYLQYFWSLAGYGCPQGHVYALSCSIGMLQSNAIVRKCRYWGRIHGLKLNYHIAEVELSDAEIAKRAGGEVGQEDGAGKGLNRRSYFVCNCLGDEWIELPKVTPNDIELSQKIRKYFTGDLNSEIRSNPKFPGSERNLLRATIQRITTETLAAPVGYYIADGGTVSINANYDSIEAAKLLELSSWIQYRMVKTPLCSENATISSVPTVPTWTIRRMLEQFPKTSMVVIRSNIWPGAVSFSSNREHDSLYVGWGVKYTSKAFIPPLPLTTSKEYEFNAKALNDETPGLFAVKDAGSAAYK